MSVPTFPCPNCGTPWLPGANVCPHCGYLRPGIPTWPPPPTGFAPPSLLPAANLVTGKVEGDVMFGLAISVASCFVTLSLMTGYHSLFPANLGWGLGLLAPPILYFILRPRYTALARGLGWGVLTGCIVLPFAVVAVLVALALGVLSLCGSMNGTHGR